MQKTKLVFLPLLMISVYSVPLKAMEAPSQAMEDSSQIKANPSCPFSSIFSTPLTPEESAMMAHIGVSVCESGQLPADQTSDAEDLSSDSDSPFDSDSEQLLTNCFNSQVECDDNTRLINPAHSLRRASLLAKWPKSPLPKIAPRFLHDIYRFYVRNTLNRPLRIAFISQPSEWKDLEHIEVQGRLKLSAQSSIELPSRILYEKANNPEAVRLLHVPKEIECHIMIGHMLLGLQDKETNRGRIAIIEAFGKWFVAERDGKLVIEKEPEEEVIERKPGLETSASAAIPENSPAIVPENTGILDSLMQKFGF